MFSDSRMEWDWEFLEFVLWQLKRAVPGGPWSGGRRPFSVGLPPFLLFVLLAVEGLFCCPSVVQGLITQSTSAPAQITIEIRPLPLLLCPTPAGGSYGMRNAEIRSPHSLWKCLKCYLAPAMTSHGSDSRRPLTVWTPCQATAEGCVCVHRQRQPDRFRHCGQGRGRHVEVIVSFGVLPDWGSLASGREKGQRGPVNIFKARGKMKDGVGCSV